MAIRKTSRQGVIDHALRLFRRNGYHYTSMADIGTACGLLKGSIYHYFSTKEELASATLEKEINVAKEHIFNSAYQEGKSDQQRLIDFAEGISLHFKDREGGCLMANFAFEAGNTLPELMPIIAHYFEEWVESLAHILEKRYGRHRALELAADSLARTQGALLLMKVDNRAQAALQRTQHDMLSLLS
jgi:TetR/AcrR family transcriptional repressor of lmrAB and yxaGH operons